MLQEDVARRVLVTVCTQPAKLALVPLRAAGVVQSAAATAATAATAALRRVALLAHHYLLAVFQCLPN